MANYAKVNNGIVVNVIVAEPEFFETFVDTSPGEWIETSYNTHAGIGYSYDKDKDAFIPPKPLPSMILNEETCLWEYSTPYPTDGKRYKWDEPTTSWIEVPAQ